MEYKISDLIDEDGNLRSVPKGFTALLVNKRLLLIKGNMSAVIVKVYKDVYAVRAKIGNKVKYFFVRSDWTIIKGGRLILNDKREIILDTLEDVIMKLEDFDEIDKVKDSLFALYLIKNCLKGDDSSCNELENLRP